MRRNLLAQGKFCLKAKALSKKFKKLPLELQEQLIRWRKRTIYP